jgi:EmrB/QacA subfamily drug resistance transporter
MADVPAAADRGNKYLTLTAMIFAVSMTFIDMTIVSIAIPEIQKDLGLSQTGVQWVVNGYLLALAALFAFGGRLADIKGHRRMVVLGVVIFAVASMMNGLTPTGDIAETWLIVFRVVQGAGAAIMYPAALAIVVDAFSLRERGRALAVFFAVAGGLTALGPLAGGYLSEWTWRAIFFVNLPVAVIALVLTTRAKPSNDPIDQPMDYRGLALIVAGMTLSVLGLQQSSVWGWDSPATWAAIVVGLGLLVVFVLYERGVEYPLVRVQIFENRAFFVQNIVLFLTMIVFVPIFFFASVYVQVSLGWSASSAGTYLLIFFAGFAPAAQIGGRMLDNIGAKLPVVLGGVIAAVGFYFWARELTDLSVSAQWPYIVLAGAGLGLLVGPSNTDAINRAPRTSYGEATGITQTVRNYGSSLGLAVLGTILITLNVSYVTETLEGVGLPADQAEQIANSMSQSGGGDSTSFNEQSPQAQDVFEDVQTDFAEASSVVFYVMSGVMLASALVAAVGLRRGRQDLGPDDTTSTAAPSAV